MNVYLDYGQKTNFRAESIESKARDYTIVDPETKKEKAFASTAATLRFTIISAESVKIGT